MVRPTSADTFEKREELVFKLSLHEKQKPQDDDNLFDVGKYVAEGKSRLCPLIYQ